MAANHHKFQKRPLPEPDPEKTTAKQQKLNRSYSHNSRTASAFWDNLSQLWLTTSALQELDRITSRGERTLSPKTVSHVLTPQVRQFWAENYGLIHQPANEFLHHCPPYILKDIQQFARCGGPDLSGVRGCHGPVEQAKAPFGPESSQNSSTSVDTPPSTGQSIVTTTTERSNLYDTNFEQHLIDFGIYTHTYTSSDGEKPPKPANMSEIKERLERRRSSLSSSTFDLDETFQQFVQADNHAETGRQVQMSVLPILQGDTGDGECISGNPSFRNLDHLTDGSMFPGNPNVYHGAPPESLDRDIINRLSGLIVPTSHSDRPIVPNFFFTARGPYSRTWSAAHREACYNGALGARAMHNLQSFGRHHPDFDDKAYTITSVYMAGGLKLFTVHPFKSTSSNRTEYCMTHLRAFPMIDNAQSFREGLTWYRNALEWAKEQREATIEEANKRAACSAKIGSCPVV